jgi:hypothetical protein
MPESRSDQRHIVPCDASPAFDTGRNALYCAGFAPAGANDSRRGNAEGPDHPKAYLRRQFAPSVAFLEGTAT